MLIKVKVFPKSKKEEILKKSEDSFEIKVKEKPERGEANVAAIMLLASFLKIPKEKIRIIKGSKQRNKILKVG
ncbi:MAG: DUF167 domain-containing protein [Candidatus Nealsonbacteria bacterium]|nr:DUF167 domain-containing protein [Candidatus Nealsonbacteria bacterium]